jgi:transitional endoplasmic reticulum ATPase
MSKPSHPLCSDLSLDIPPLVHLWLLRLIVPLGGHKEFLMRDGFASDDLALGLGLAKWIDPVHEGFDKGKIMTALRKFHRAEEQKIFNASRANLI